MSPTLLALDPTIRDKVLIPLLIFVVIFSLGRTYLFRLLQAKPDASAVDKVEIRQKNVIARSTRLRTHMAYISSGGAAMRREWLADDKDGQLKAETAPAAAANPMAAMDAMKTQMVNQGVFLGLFYAIQNVLAGFLVVKMPFGLTERFKQLTQQGIGVAALDTSYVSSGSWYMISQQGLSRALQLLDAGSVVSEAAMMQMQMMGPMAGGAGAGPWNAKAAFAAEAGALAVTKYHSALVETERELLAAARALPPAAAAAR